MQARSSNHLAAKLIHLRMKGNHDQAENLLKQAHEYQYQPGHGAALSQKRKLGNADTHFEEGSRRKVTRKSHPCSVLTHQQDYCNFCFDTTRKPPLHLVVTIADFTLLMLPQSKPLVQGHCCILTIQHESSTRTVDNNVWDEIRNFKKCLIMMFTKQNKEVVFLETVMGTERRRHCLVECIPLPREVAKQAPVFFKKAIDEAESEWSQHEAKKLIDTSVKGLRGSVPEGFPYFHVEFGLKKGFVHVIDDESRFRREFGVNVVRGMLGLPAEDMHRRRKNEGVEMQKKGFERFVKDWEPFDWTKQLRD